MDVAEEPLHVDRTIDRTCADRRLAGWSRRLERLDADMDRWSLEAWSTADGEMTRAYDEKMRRFDLTAQDPPIRTLLRDDEQDGRLEPRGFWIIEANSRVGLTPLDATTSSLIAPRASNARLGRSLRFAIVR